MAEATRFKDLIESQKKLDQVLQAESMKRVASEQKIQEQISGIDKKYENLTNTLAEIQLQLLNMSKHSGEDSVLGKFGGSPGSGFMKSAPHLNYACSPLPRIDFPRFDGSNPRAWILKCNSYFKLMPGIPDAQRVSLATMHFDGKALTWFQNLNMVEVGITWTQFLEVVAARFEDLRVSSIIVEFNKLKHTGTYEEYVERFDELRGCMVMNDASKYSEEYFIASFLSGLSEELQSFINMFQPTSLEQTIELGKKQMHTLDALAKRITSPHLPVTSQAPTYTRAESAPSEVFPNKNNTPLLQPPTKMLTSAEMAARREKGLCYNCDEPYKFGHRCKNRINYVMMTEAEELLDAQKVVGLELQEVENNMVQHFDEVHMSLYSLIGEHGPTTMKVVGEVGNQELHILLDTGSTLSFLQEDTAKRLGCAIHNAKPLLVRVANGQRLVSAKQATDFQWSVQGHQFQFSPRLLKTKGCDMILGGDWLRLCSPIELDYDNMVFTVTVEGEKIKLNALNIALDSTLGNQPMLTSLSHEEIISAEEVFILDTGTIGEGVVDGMEFPHVSVAWLNFGSDLESLHLKLPSLDPWGQGSTNPGGIVMAKEGLELEVKEDVDTEKSWEKSCCDSISAEENK